MSITTLLLATCVSSSLPDSLDIKTFDKTKLNNQEKKRKTYDDFIGNPKPFRRDIQIPQESIYFGSLDLKLPKRIPVEKLDISIYLLQPSTQFFLYPQALKVSYQNEKKNTVRVTYAIETKEKSELKPHTLNFSISISEISSRKPLRVRKFKQNIKILPPVPSTASPEFLVETHNHFQALASKLGNELPPGMKSPNLRNLPKSISKRELPPDWLRRFFGLRLKAVVAERVLRKMLTTTTEKNRDNVLKAILGLRFFERSTQRRLTPYTTNPENALNAAEKKFLRYELSDALYLAKFARNSGKLKSSRLAKSLLMIGGIQLLSEPNSKAAFENMSKAMCLSSEQAFPIQSLRVQTTINQIKAANQCIQKLSIQQVKARRIFREGVNLVEVSGVFGPDPYKMVSGGTIELWGAGGDVIETAQIRAERGTINRVVSTFEDRGDIQNYVGDILIRIILKDIAGTELAYYGQNDPIALSIDESGISFVDKWGPWLWILTGIAVASAGAFTYFHFSGQEPERGIGPVNIRF